eukprot:scaffold47254_cov21-Tisochrysis_lutea.AAC.1
MNKPDPNGKDPWDTVRDMSKVGSVMHRVCINAASVEKIGRPEEDYASQVWKKLPDFGPKNTLLLDNEARKFAGDAANGIV